MTAMGIAPAFGALTTFRARALWRHPEWWALALSAAAWLTIVSDALAGSTATHSSHAAVVGTPMIEPIAFARGWLLMIAAMMLPLGVDAIRATADRSLWRRRNRAIAAWLCGYVMACFLPGAVVSIAIALQRPTGRSTAFVALSFAFASLWQVSAWRARALAMCHRTQPLSPDGWRADYDCMRYGWTIGWWCSLACGALMFACWLLGHGAPGVAAMAIATGIGVAERRMVRSHQRWLVAPIAAMALVATTTR
jgi:hypothetical protein